MKVIGICSTKGGGGKSTLATALAGFAHMLGEPTALIDMDAGQGSTAAWAAARARAGKSAPEIVRVRSLRADLRRLEARGFAYVVIDSPPTLDDSGVVEAAVEASTHIISPCRPSILDIGAAATIAELAGDTPVGFVLMDVTTAAGWKGINEEAAKALKDVGHVFKSRISHRPSYVDNLAAGLLGFETDKTAMAEVGALWGEISQWMK